MEPKDPTERFPEVPGEDWKPGEEEAFEKAKRAYIADKVEHYLRNPEDTELDVLVEEDGRRLVAMLIRRSQTDPLEAHLEFMNAVTAIAIRLATGRPTARNSLWVPPAPGMMPTLHSGWPNRAVKSATITSHIMASSQPAPRA